MYQSAEGHVPERLSEPSARRRTERVRRSGGRFLKGPVPLYWLQRAASLPGKALAVGVAIWFMSGVTKNKTVRATNGLVNEYGVSRKARYRAIAALEAAGLVTVRRRQGATPRVTIVVDD